MTKIKILIMPSANTVWSNCESVVLLTGMHNTRAVLEGILAVLYEIKYTLTIGPSSTTPGYLYQRYESSVHVKACT